MNIAVDTFRPGFLAPVIQLLAQAMPREAISEADFTRQVLLDPNFRAPGALVALANGEVAGFCLAIGRHVPLENAPDDSERGYITLLAVAEKQRRRGVGARLLDAAHAYLKGQGCKAVLISPYVPGYFVPGVDVAAYADALRFLTRRGYDKVYRPLAMQIGLQSWRTPDYIAQKQERLERIGVMLQLYRSELTPEILAFARREFPGDWVRIVRAAMDEICGGGFSSRLICALDGANLLGFAHHDGERFGPIGVAASERGRGIGQVLMGATLRAQCEAGCTNSWFRWSDDQTAARLYRGAGFVETRRFAVLWKDLVTAAS